MLRGVLGRKVLQAENMLFPVSSPGELLLLMWRLQSSSAFPVTSSKIKKLSRTHNSGPVVSTWASHETIHASIQADAKSD